MARTKDITNTAIGVAAIIGGGFVIFQFSNMFPIPGMKYIMMAPFLSLMFYILLAKLDNPFSLLRISVVFGGIMMVINIAMGSSIIVTGILAQLVILPIKDPHMKNIVGSIAFAGLTSPVALLLSKLIIQGYFEVLTPEWMFVAFLISSTTGAMGTYLAVKLYKLVNNGSRS